MLPLSNHASAPLARLSQTLQRIASCFRSMLAFEPIITNSIALALCCAALLIVKHPTLLPAMGKYYGYFSMLLRCLAAWQVILSARKSLLLPLLTLLVAGVGFILVAQHVELAWLPMALLKNLMLLGLIGLAVSIFSIR